MGETYCNIVLWNDQCSNIPGYQGQKKPREIISVVATLNFPEIYGLELQLKRKRHQKRKDRGKEKDRKSSDGMCIGHQIP